MNFNSLIRLPKIQVAGFLFVFFCLSASIIGWGSALRLFVTCIGFTILFDLGFIYLRIRKLLFPSAAIVTGLILTLIIEPSASWLQIAIIATAAMGMKNFVRISGRHVFNPAAFGLFAGWILFGLNPSWWAATLYPWDKQFLANIVLYVLFIGIAYISCYKLRRYLVAATYLMISFLFSIFFSSSFIGALQTVISPGVLFFSVVMLVEPMTSPVRVKNQIIYGLFVAFVQILFLVIFRNFGIENLRPDASIIALLIGNLVFFKFR